MGEKIEVILLDIGNTRIKSIEVINGVFQDQKTWKNIETFNKYYPSDIPIMISAVGKFDRTLFNQTQVIILDYKSRLPILLDYKTPETLGSDRIAAAVGAFALYPDRDNLIIDIGTCITIDFLDKEAKFQGGIISPGLKMRMKAMSNYTSRLPDISNTWESIEKNYTGKSTKECLVSGSYYGIIHELNGTINAFTKDFTSINVILTGGDAHFFESKLKATIFAGSKIVEIGLYEIWKNNSAGNN